MTSCVWHSELILTRHIQQRRPRHLVLFQHPPVGAVPRPVPPEVVHLSPALGPGVCMSVAQGTCSKDCCTGGGARRKC